MVKLSKENFINILGKSKDEQMRYIMENNEFVISYEEVNRRIARVNNKLIIIGNRELTLEIIGFDEEVEVTLNISTKELIHSDWPILVDDNTLLLAGSSIKSSIVSKLRNLRKINK